MEAKPKWDGKILVTKCSFRDVHTQYSLEAFASNPKMVENKHVKRGSRLGSHHYELTLEEISWLANVHPIPLQHICIQFPISSDGWEHFPLDGCWPQLDPVEDGRVQNIDPSIDLVTYELLEKKTKHTEFQAEVRGMFN